MCFGISNACDTRVNRWDVIGKPMKDMAKTLLKRVSVG